MRPERGPARIDRAGEVDRIERHRHEQIEPDRERDAEPYQTIIQESPASFARQARPDEQAGQEEQQLHQVDVLQRAEQVEAEPARAVDDRVRAPSIRRDVERQLRRRLRAEIGDERMERDHHDDGEGA